jgi:malate/lactate dehydrogenase
MDLIGVNAKIVRSVTEQVVKHAPDAVLIVVSNPLDEMTALAGRPGRLAGDLSLEALDRPRLAHIECEAFRLALDDVGKHDLIKNVVLGQSLRRGRAVETGADDRYLPCAGH